MFILSVLSGMNKQPLALQASSGDTTEPWSLAMNIQKQYGVYFESKTSRIICNWINFLVFIEF